MDLTPARALASATIAATLLSFFSPGIAGDVDDAELLLPVCFGLPLPAMVTAAFRGGGDGDGGSLALRLWRCAGEGGLLTFALGGTAGEVSEPELDFWRPALFFEAFRCFLPPSGELRRFPFATASFSFCFCLLGGGDDDLDGLRLAAFVDGGAVALAGCPRCRSLSSLPWRCCRLSSFRGSVDLDRRRVCCGGCEGERRLREAERRPRDREGRRRPPDEALAASFLRSLERERFAGERCCCLRCRTERDLPERRL